MSAIWFIILLYAWANGIEVSDINFLMIAIFLHWRLHFT